MDILATKTCFTTENLQTSVIFSTFNNFNRIEVNYNIDPKKVPVPLARTIIATRLIIKYEFGSSRSYIILS